jgi:hypothetical protein
MSYEFGKDIKTAKGDFKAGQPLPLEWTGKETIRQIRERYGEEAVMDAGLANASVNARLASIEESLSDIKRELGIKPAGDATGARVAVKGRA